MLQLHQLYRSATNGARVARFAATLCVLGLVGVLWLNAGTGPDGASTAAAVAPDSQLSNDFLHAPADVSSVPSAQSVFGNTPATAVEDMPPTF